MLSLSICENFHNQRAFGYGYFKMPARIVGFHIITSTELAVLTEVYLTGS
jgi:hypothetical protein